MARGRKKLRRGAEVIGGWGTRKASFSLAVMVAALFMGRDAVAQVAGAVFILAAVLAAVGHIVGET
jgi:hypothetical protein